MTSPLVQLAKEAIVSYVTEKRTISAPTELTPEMAARASVFVSIHDGRGLRGCIGTIAPRRANVAEEIITNAISAATYDPRFNPVTIGELDELEISVDVLFEPELITNMAELDPKKYGLIVESGLRHGLLLPNLPGVETAHEQIDICRSKGGIPPGVKLKLYRFEVKRYE